MRSFADRVADVRRVLDAARALRDRPGALVAELVRTTGLSSEGVARGLRDHLEVTATDQEISALVEAAGDAEAVHVILSSNVFVAPLRALALARAAAPRVTLRPSSREPIFARALVEVLDDAAVTLVDARPAESIALGEVHLYGSDATIAEVRRHLRPEVRLRAHGSGMGLALVGEDASLEAAAADLAADVVPFDQRGCLSPRVALVVGPYERARAFAERAFAALEHEARVTPRGALLPEEVAEVRRYIETARFAGELHEAASHVVGVSERLTVPPAGRHVHVVPVASLEVARDVLAPLARVVVTVGLAGGAAIAGATRSPSAGASAAGASLVAHLGVPHARLAMLGRMQRPPLDGPVDRR